MAGSQPLPHPVDHEPALQPDRTGTARPTAVTEWTGALAVALQEATRETQESFAHRLGLSTRGVARWHERPDSRLRTETAALLDTVLTGLAPAERERFSLLMAIDRARPEPEPDGDWIRRVAQQSSTEALLRSGRLSADVLPTLVQEVMSLANGYDTESRLAGLRHARDVSEVASTLADRTRRPSELVDLYASLGQLNALMASLAFDLDRWDAAETLARTASSYADMSGHSSLHAWTLGLRATLAFWRADPRLALDHVDHGLAIAPMGAPSYRLHHIEARAHAVAGNVEGVRASIGAANAQLDFMEGLRDDLHDGIGGEFAFGYVRGTACAGAAWLRVGDGHQALKTTYRAIRALVSDPAPSTNVVNGLLIDGAAASALDGDIATARALITPALDLSPDRSTVSTTGRLKNVLTVLRPLEANREARELAEQAEAYLAAGRLAAEAAKPRPLGD